MDARRGGRANGHDSAKAVTAAAALPAAPLVLPASAAQKSRFPYLEHFAARMQLTGDGQTPKLWELSLGLRLGLKPGRQIVVSFTPGMPGRALAALFRELAARIDAWADDIDAGRDPQPNAAPEGQTPTPSDPAAVLARAAALRSLAVCAACGAPFGDPHAPGCAIAGSTCAVCGAAVGEQCKAPIGAVCPQLQPEPGTRSAPPPLDDEPE